MDDAKQNADLRKKVRDALSHIISHTKHYVELISVFNLADLNIVTMIIPRLEQIFRDETMTKDDAGQEVKLGQKAKIQFIQNNGQQMLMSWRKTLTSGKIDVKDATEIKNSVDKLAELLPEKLKYI